MEPDAAMTKIAASPVSTSSPPPSCFASPAPGKDNVASPIKTGAGPASTSSTAKGKKSPTKKPPPVKMDISPVPSTRPSPSPSFSSSISTTSATAAIHTPPVASSPSSPSSSAVALPINHRAPSSSPSPKTPAPSSIATSMSATPLSPSSSPSHSPSSSILQPPPAATLIAWCKNVVAHDMGLKDEDLLDDDFYFIGPFDGPVGKRLFIDGSLAFDLRGAFPDFDFRAHDFRVDEVQPFRVWFTTRKAGTHRGDLPMYGKTIKPTLRVLDFPPEAYSCTFTPEGKCIKLTGGFVMDATRGNSSGLGGPLGIAAAVGHPLSTFSVQPPLRALLETVKSKTSSLLPALPPSLSALWGEGGREGGREGGKMPVLPSETTLTEAELLSLASSFLSSSPSSPPPSLPPSFLYTEPLLGKRWIGKEEYLQRQLDCDWHGAFSDITILTYNLRLDRHQPATVWADVRRRGTHTGSKSFGGKEGSLFAIPPASGLPYVSAPEAVSLTFNDKKQLVRMTAAAVLDREEGNTGGLGGIYGAYYALNRPSLPLLTRPLRFHSLREWKTSILKSFAGPALAKLPIVKRYASSSFFSPSKVAPSSSSSSSSTLSHTGEKKRKAEGEGEGSPSSQKMALSSE